jgi:hypothetical protein
LRIIRNHGVHIVSVADHARPVLVSSYALHSAHQLAVRGNYIYVASGSSGLWIEQFNEY